jgi:hypothetical protein
MHPRTTGAGRAASRHGRAVPPRRVPLAAGRRPGLLLAVAAAGAVGFNAVVGAGPAAQADAATEPVSIAEELGLTAQSEAVGATADLDPLEDLVASRSSREAAEAAARQVQAKADRAQLERQKAAARAKAEKAARAAKAAAEATAKETAAAEAAEEEEAADEPAASSSAAVAAIAQISNSLGPVRPQAQAAANAVVSNVPGAANITIGGTRASAADPGGHPSGLALDYMVMSDAALGDAIVQYHIANWDALGVEYVIWQQRMLSSPGGSWSSMADRGSPTANHMDHPHVNYR